MRFNYDYTVTPTLIVHMGAGYLMYRSPDVAALGVLEYDAPGQLGLYGGIPNNFANPSITATGFPRNYRHIDQRLRNESGNGSHQRQ